MGHKLIIAQNLRAGLAEIKAMYQRAFRDTTPFREQWDLLLVKQAYDIDWHTHEKAVIENNFAWRSRKLLRRISGD